MPQTQYIDDHGKLEYVASASSIGSNGTSITGSLPGLSPVPIGTYPGLSGNIASNAEFNVVGAGAVLIQNTYNLTGNYNSGLVIAVGTGVNTTYGRPYVQLWSQDSSTVLRSAQAYSTTVQSPGYLACYFNLGSVPTGGAFPIYIFNVNSDRSQTAIGNATLYN